MAQARSALLAALDIDPQSAEAHWLLGSLLLDIDEPALAARHLGRAQAAGWPDEAASAKWASALLQAGDYDALEGLKIDALGDTAQTSVLAIRAQGWIERGQRAKAEALVATAQDLQPRNPELAIARAQLQASANRHERAERILGNALQRSPGHPQLLLNLGEVQLHRYRLLAARDTFASAIEHSGTALRPLLNHALVALQLGDIEAARQDAAALTARAPEWPATHYVNGLIFLEDGESKDAVEALNRARQLSDVYPLIHYALGRALFFTGAQRDAARYAATYQENYPANIAGIKLLAAVHLRQADYARAQRLLEPLLDRNPVDRDALYLLAVVQARSDQKYAALTTLERLGRLSNAQDPRDSVADAALIEAALSNANGNRGSATAAEEVIAAIYAAQKAERHETAIAEAQKLRWSSPAEPDRLRLLASVYLSAREKSLARTTIDSLLKIDPSDPVGNQILAALALQNNRPQRARQYYLKILDRHPHDLTTLLRLATLELELENEAAFTARLMQARQAHPQAPAPRVQLALYYLQHGNVWEAQPLLASLNELQRSSPPVMATQLLIDLTGGRRPLTEKQVALIAASAPASETFFKHLVDAAAQAGRLDEVEARLRELLRATPRHLPSVTALALIALVENDIQRLRAFAAALAQLQPTEATPTQLQLRAAADANGDSPDAPNTPTERQLPSAHQVETLTDLELELEQRPDDPDILVQKAQVLAALGADEEATQLLKRALKGSPQDFAERANAQQLLMKLMQRASLGHGVTLPPPATTP